MKTLYDILDAQDKNKVLDEPNFKLGKRSLQRLSQVHPDLQVVVARAIEITEVDFTVMEGLRTIETQISYCARGVSRTYKSRHLPHFKDEDGSYKSYAVDLGAIVGKKISWDMKHYLVIFKAMQTAAKELDINIRSGLDWDNDKIAMNNKSSLVDGPHYELPRSSKFPDGDNVLKELKKRNLI